MLANVTSLTIKAEFHNGVSEIVGIDNVAITAVAETGEWALLLAGLGVISAAAFRRRG